MRVTMTILTLFALCLPVVAAEEPTVGSFIQRLADGGFALANLCWVIRWPVVETHVLLRQLLDPVAHDFSSARARFSSLTLLFAHFKQYTPIEALRVLRTS